MRNSRQGNSQSSTKVPTRLNMVQLEDRAVPATHVFLMGNGDWSNNANWDIGRPVPDGNNPVRVVFTEGQIVTVDAVVPGLTVNEIRFAQNAAVTLKLNVDLKVSPAAGEIFAINALTNGNTIEGPGSLILGNNTPGTDVGVSVANGKSFGINSGRAGSGDLFIDTAATVRLAGPQTGTGQTIVAGGNVLLFSNATGGKYLVGVGTGTSALLTVANANTVSVDEMRISNDGNVGLAINSQLTVNKLFLGTSTAGTSIQGAGKLRIADSLTVTGLNKLSEINCPVDFINASETTISASGNLNINETATSTKALLFDGGGTVRLTATDGNALTGLTTVLDGTLALATPAGKPALSGAIAVGETLGSAVLRLDSNNVIADGKTVTVGVNGTLEVNGKTETIGAAFINAGGKLNVGAGNLTTGNLFVTANNVTLTDAGVLNAKGNITAIPSGNAKDIGILGGTISFGGLTSEVTASGNSILTISSKLTNGKIETFGSGTIALTALSVNPFQMDVNSELVRVTGLYPAMAVTIDGGTLSGTGLVGVLNGLAGKFSPGVPLDSFVSSNLSLNSATSFLATVFQTGQQSQVNVAGTVSLGNSKLILSQQAPVQIGNTFPILLNDGTDPVQGTFFDEAEGSIITLGQNQFRISYVDGDGNDVVLKAVAASTTVLTVTPASGAIAGDAIQLKAVVTSTSGNPSGEVKFFSGGSPIGSAMIDVGGVAELNLPAAFAVAGEQTFSAVFDGDSEHSGSDDGKLIYTITANTAPSIGAIANQSILVNSAAGPIAFTISDAQTLSESLIVSTLSSNLTLLPVAGLILGGSGNNRVVTLTPVAGQTGTTTITIQVVDPQGLISTRQFDLTVTTVPPVIPPVTPPVTPPITPPVVPPVTPPGVPPVVPPGVPLPTLVGDSVFAVGSDSGLAATARFFNADQSSRLVDPLKPFADFTGGVRVATGDINGDGIADIVVGSGPGRSTKVTIIDGKTSAEIKTIEPFEAAFKGGVFVSVGDLNGDGFADLAISPDEGGGPRVRVFSGKTLDQLADFFGIEDVNFRGGARTAIGDITGDGKADLVVAAGFGGGPRVGVFNGLKLAQEGSLPDNQNFSRWNTWKPFSDFLTFEPALRNGSYVTVGDLDGDGFSELIAGGGPGGGPRVTAFSGKSLMSNEQTPMANFFAGDVNNRGGIRVAVKNLDNDGLADLVVGSGPGAGSRVTAYAGQKLLGQSSPDALFAFDAEPGFTGGVFVG